MLEKENTFILDPRKREIEFCGHKMTLIINEDMPDGEIWFWDGKCKIGDSICLKNLG